MEGEPARLTHVGLHGHDSAGYDLGGILSNFGKAGSR